MKYINILIVILGGTLQTQGQNFDLIDKGWKYYQDNKQDSAIYFYTESLKKYPREPVAYKFRAMAYERKGNRKKAIADFNRALRAGIDSTEILVERTSVFRELLKYDSAIYDINYLLVKMPGRQNQVWLYNSKAFNLIMLKQLKNAQLAAEASLRLDSTSLQALINQFHIYSPSREKTLALKTALALIKFHPDFSDGYYYAGLAYMALGNNSKSISYLQKSISVQPDNALPYADLSLHYVYMGKLDTAIMFANKAIKLNSQYAKGYLAKGMVLFGQKQYTQSIATFDKALRLDPDMIDVYNSRGKAYYGLYKYDLAEKDFNKMIQLYERHEEAYLFLGYIYKAKNRKSEACAYWKKAHDLGAVDIKDEMARYCK